MYPGPLEVSTRTQTVNSYPFIHVDALLRNAVEARIIAGAVLIAGRGVRRRHEITVGRAQIVPLERALSSSTLQFMQQVSRLRRM